MANYQKKILSDNVKKSIDVLVEQGLSLSEITKIEKSSFVIKYLLEDASYLEKYVKTIADKITSERLQISYTMVLKRIFHFSKPSTLDMYDQKFISIIKSVVDNTQEIQRAKYMLENHIQINVDRDIWKMYDRFGNGLRAEFIDFSKINSVSLRLEVKYYFCYKYNYSKKVNSSVFQLIKLVLNVLTDILPNIYYFADITQNDARKLLLFLETKYKKENGEKLSEYSIAKSLNCLKNIINYLMSDFRDDTIRSPKPHQNPFDNFTFHNLRKYTKSTLSIPEDIVYELDKHSNELSPLHKLIYDIFMTTGLRLKEVYFLEEDCIEESHYENVYQLKFKPHKVLSSRKTKGFGDYHRIMITKELADKISEYIETTVQKRKTASSNLIFLSDRMRYEGIVIDSMPFIKDVRSIIERYNICNEDGERWHFTVKQIRKTLAVKLIEEGATTAELAYWLGHMCSDTANRYYAEVRKMKLAELNTKFFKEKFDILLSSEQMESYTEEERKLLYTDFRLEYRRVELGYCLHKTLNEVCPHRNNLYNCANCKNLCTGHKYLSYWQELFEQQRDILNKLVESYIQSEIFDYTEYMEYKQEYKLLAIYQSVFLSIKKGGAFSE